MPLPSFIEELYFRRFKRDRPEVVKSVERTIEEHYRKREERKRRRAENTSLKEKDDNNDEIPF